MKVVIIILLLASAGFAQEVSVSEASDAAALIPEVIKALDAKRDAAIEWRRRDASLYARQKNMRGARMMQKDRAEIESGKTLPELDIEPPFSVGDFGFIPNAAEVLNVIDEDEVLVMFNYGDFDTQGAWIKGVAAGNLTSDSKFRLTKDHAWRVTGTTEYEAVLGKRKVVVIEPFDLAPYAQEYRDRLAAAKKKPAKPKATEPETTARPAP